MVTAFTAATCLLSLLLLLQAAAGAAVGRSCDEAADWMNLEADTSALPNCSSNQSEQCEESGRIVFKSAANVPLRSSCSSSAPNASVKVQQDGLYLVAAEVPFHVAACKCHYEVGADVQVHRQGARIRWLSCSVGGPTNSQCHHSRTVGCSVSRLLRLRRGDAVSVLVPGGSEVVGAQFFLQLLLLRR